jgi:hypothetical protein
LESGETRYVRIAVSLGPFDSGRLYLELAEADVARSELEGLRLAGEVTGQADPFR